MAPDGGASLLISCLPYGRAPLISGLVRIDKGRPRRVGKGYASGMALDGDRFARVVYSINWARLELRFAKGKKRQEFLLDGCADVHDVVWDGDLLMVSNTAHNEVVWFTQEGKRVKSWNPGGTGDAWHLGFFVPTNSGWGVTTFGRYSDHRGWYGHLPEGKGELVEVGTGETILRGFKVPHSPRRTLDGWVILDCYESQLRQFNEAGAEVGAIDLPGWPRGLDLQEEQQAWIGISPERHPPSNLKPETPQTAVIRVDLGTGAIQERIDIPLCEIYEVLVGAPAWLD